MRGMFKKCFKFNPEASSLICSLATVTYMLNKGKSYLSYATDFNINDNIKNNNDQKKVYVFTVQRDSEVAEECKIQSIQEIPLVAKVEEKIEVKEEDNMIGGGEIIDKEEEEDNMIGGGEIIDKEEEEDNMIGGGEIIDKEEEDNMIGGGEIIDKEEEDNMIGGGEIIDKEEVDKNGSIGKNKKKENDTKNGKNTNGSDKMQEKYNEDNKNKKYDHKKENTNFHKSVPHQQKLSSEDEIISLGVNIGASKTVYSTFSKVNGKYVTYVPLMNDSSRIIPSIICYTKTHRLFGENSIASLKQNIDTSYHNLSRLIGFDNSNKYEEELKYMFRKEDNINDYKFYCYDKNPKKIEIKSAYVIADYLSLINEYYFVKKGCQYDLACLSVPDFFTGYQKQSIELILKALNMQDVNIITESSAITMYYGYTKYNDVFYKENKIDTTIEKNILFIDSGHSKTSFILSYFKYNSFKVLKVICIPNVGGRNFDKEIMNYCIKEFFKKENIKKKDFILTDKMKYRLLEAIEKSRKQLTVNKATTIVVESFYRENDLNITLARDKSEEENNVEEEQNNEVEAKKDEAKTFTDLIKDELEIFKKGLEDMLQYAQDEDIKIDFVEIAGDLMRTPILQTLIEDKILKISKTILIDECTSVGAALLGNHIKGKLPISQLKFQEYNYFEGNNKNNKEISIEMNEEDFINEIKEHIKKQEEIDQEHSVSVGRILSYQKVCYLLKKKCNNLEWIKQNGGKLKNIQSTLNKSCIPSETLQKIEEEIKPMLNYLCKETIIRELDGKKNYPQKKEDFDKMKDILQDGNKSFSEKYEILYTMDYFK